LLQWCLGPTEFRFIKVGVVWRVLRRVWRTRR
jgi:hypothetical protein